LLYYLAALAALTLWGHRMGEIIGEHLQEETPERQTQTQDTTWPELADTPTMIFYEAAEPIVFVFDADPTYSRLWTVADIDQCVCTCNNHEEQQR
jgi:hypothetical protein